MERFGSEEMGDWRCSSSTASMVEGFVEVNFSFWIGGLKAFVNDAGR